MYPWNPSRKESDPQSIFFAPYRNDRGVSFNLSSLHCFELTQFNRETLTPSNAWFRPPISVTESSMLFVDPNTSRLNPQYPLFREIILDRLPFEKSVCSFIIPQRFSIMRQS